MTGKCNDQNTVTDVVFVAEDSPAQPRLGVNFLLIIFDSGLKQYLNTIHVRLMRMTLTVLNIDWGHYLNSASIQIPAK